MNGTAGTKRRGVFIGLFFAVGKVLGKVGPKLVSFLAKLGKAAKVGKGALAAGSFGAYAVLWSWKFALLIMVSLFVHETGHLWAMRRYGMRTKGIYFIPFLGAAAVADEMFPTRKAESVIALMGPIWGLGLALAAYGAHLATGSPIWAALAGWMAMLNLFNLLPINPLDGGRVMKSVCGSISSRLGLAFLVAGLVGAFIVCLKLNLGLLVFLMPIGILELIGEIKEFRRNRDRGAVIVALSRKLGTAMNAEAVLAKLTEMRAEAEATIEASRGQLGMAGGVAHLIHLQISSLWDERRKRWEATKKDITACAAAARRPRLSWFGFGKTVVFDTAEHELAVASWNDLGLFEYLKGKSFAGMTPTETAAAFLGYIALAATLAWLMFAASHVEAAKGALHIFMG